MTNEDEITIRDVDQKVAEKRLLDRGRFERRQKYRSLGMKFGLNVEWECFTRRPPNVIQTSWRGASSTPSSSRSARPSRTVNPGRVQYKQWQKWM